MHSLDSLELAEELDKKLKAKNKTMNCLLQVNSANEDTKSGVNPKNAAAIYKEIEEKYSNIKLKGIMSIGAHVDDKQVILESFKTTKSIYDKTSGSVCSMGMSSDFQLAINEGSNMIRVGSALFK
jgi:pyridoxal phosphate enzyme (YggS family)